MESPSAYMKNLLKDYAGKRRTTGFNDTDRDELMQNYDFPKITAIRKSNLNKLRDLLEGKANFDACNRNGETLIHLACRRSSIEVVEFLVREAGVKVEVQDDLGRSVLHDICWRADPDFQVMEMMMKEVSPDFLLAEDARGHNCFDYCHQKDWGKWIEFLKKHSDLLVRRAEVYYNIISKANPDPS